VAVVVVVQPKLWPDWVVLVVVVWLLGETLIQLNQVKQILAAVVVVDLPTNTLRVVDQAL
jgi:hypothetical protein